MLKCIIDFDIIIDIILFLYFSYFLRSFSYYLFFLIHYLQFQKIISIKKYSIPQTNQIMFYSLSLDIYAAHVANFS